MSGGDGAPGVEVRGLRPDDTPAVRAFLAAHADSSLFLRRNLDVGGLVDREARYHGAWAGAFAGGRLVAVAQHTQVFQTLLVQAPVEAASVARLAARASGRVVGGFIGPRAHVSAAREALGLAAAPLRLHSDEGLYALPLHALRVPDLLASGRARCRRARTEDLDALARWRADFRVEMSGDEPGPALAAASREDVSVGIAERAGFVLELDGAPVAYQQFNATVDDVVQVGGVWTPPALRGRGYARAVVAGSLLAAGEDGARRAVLFTGETNVFAQRAYAALGFTRVGDFSLVFLAMPVMP